MVLPSPNLDKGRDILVQKKLKAPRMIFPSYFTRANAAAPATVYLAGSSVVLSPTDSMIYHWRSKSRFFPLCYLTAWVSPTEDLIRGSKSYKSDGDITSIEIWNVTTPSNPKTLKTMSWNTRPQRVSLLGTVNFTSVETQRRDLELDGQQLRAPTPRFNCPGVTEITVEVVCSACYLEFEQVICKPYTCPCECSPEKCAIPSFL
ncbi:hypothetical protein DFH06DRAFT_1109294 [Mycena polygramma]|nr:hypothetical protein DFH06DRAFT_1109294 [Mycena polygramma]